MFWGIPSGIDAYDLAKKLYNPMIERSSISDKDMCLNGPKLDFPEKKANIDSTTFSNYQSRSE